MDASEASAYGPSWYSATMVAAPERPALGHDLDVDACVIGAGLAGLTTALELARRGWSVAVVEAGRVAWNASGRNAGVVAPGYSEDIAAIVERVGPDRARALWALSVEGVDAVRRTIAETAMPGVAPVDGRLVVQRIDDEDALLRRVAMLNVDFGAEVEAWPAAQVREVLRSPAYFQGMHEPAAFHVHALNYALGLAAAAEAAGAKVFERTAAVEIDPAGVRKRITTPQARIRAGHIVLAGGAHMPPLHPLVGGTVQTVATHVAVTAPLGDRLFDAVRYTGAVADTRRAGDTYRIVDGDRLMWSGRFSTRPTAPRRLAEAMRRDIVATYPQLAGVEITHAWTGAMAYAVHRMPLIGQLSQGLWLATAFGGRGLAATAAAGRLIAAAILDGDDRWRLYSPYELVWAGGTLGRIVTQGLAWSARARDAFEERLARRRERARAAAAERAALAASHAAAHEAERAAEAERAGIAAEAAAHRAQEDAVLGRPAAAEPPAPDTAAAAPSPQAGGAG